MHISEYGWGVGEAQNLLMTYVLKNILDCKVLLKDTCDY